MILRRLLHYYRYIQYLLYGRARYGVMAPGQRSVVVGAQEDETYGDVVHPCVRYISEGFRGHKWWMVYTPYYGANAKLENPRLCWGESDDSTPPIRWHIEDVIIGQHEHGYNSDPSIFYEQDSLYVYWRENETSATTDIGLCRATYCKVYKENKVTERLGPILCEELKFEDKEICPTILSHNGRYRAYCMHLVFKNAQISKSRFLQKVVTITDLLGIYSQQKFVGVSLWIADNPIKKFDYIKSVKFENCNKLYRPWHMDLFNAEGELYAIIQSNQSNADICLAKCLDGEVFRMYSRPLLTNASIGMIGIYKPTALVVDGRFILYYTAQDIRNRKLNKLFVVDIDFNELLSILS